MKYVYDHDLHIHSGISMCSGDPEQTAERILQYAKDMGLKQICVTDHFWDETVPCEDRGFYTEQGFERISKILPLPQAEGIEFLFGAETDLNKDYILGVSKEVLEKLDFLVIPTTHLHMAKFAVGDENLLSSPEKRAEIWVKRLDYVLGLDLPFHKVGIAHLTCPLIAPNHNDYIATLNAIPDSELERLFSKCASLGVGIELNRDDMDYKVSDEDSVLRIFKAAKKQGCKFYLGGDAHHPETFNVTKKVFEHAIAALDLKETDKFILKK